MPHLSFYPLSGAMYCVLLTFKNVIISCCKRTDFTFKSMIPAEFSQLLSLARELCHGRESNKATGHFTIRWNSKKSAMGHFVTAKNCVFYTVNWSLVNQRLRTSLLPVSMYHAFLYISVISFPDFINLQPIPFDWKGCLFMPSYTGHICKAV